MTLPERLDELTALERALDAFDHVPADDYFGGRLMKAGLERRRAQVLARRLERAPRPDDSVDLAIAPAHEGGGGAEVALVSSVLASLQELVQAVAQSVKDRPTARGVIPGEIQEAVRLRVAFALPGSLSLRIIPADPAKQQPLFEDGDESLLQLSLDEVLTLLRLASSGDSGGEAHGSDLLQHLVSVGPRATTHLGSLMVALAKHGAEMRVRWRSRGNVRDTRIDSVAASRFEAFLKRVDVAETSLVLRGRLVGGSLIRRTFELEIPDETALEASVRSGKVDEAVLPDLERLFGEYCTAYVDVRQATLPSGEVRESLTLTRLQE